MTAIGAIKDHLALINHPCFLLSLKEGDSTESSARKIDLVATMADCVEDIIGDLTDLAELDIQKRSGNWWPDGVEFLKKEARYHKRLHEGLRKHQELCENLRVLSGQYLKLHPRGDSVSVEEY